MTIHPTPIPRFIQIDREGYFMSEGVRISDEVYGRSLFTNLSRGEDGILRTRTDNMEIIVEAFDEPLVASQVSVFEDQWKLELPYGYATEFQLSSLRLDQWDRFRGLDYKGISFVLSRKAQGTFFDLLDGFEDDSIIFKGKRYEILPFYQSNPEANKNTFWGNRYTSSDTPWDIKEPNPILIDALAQIKMPKSKVLVPGAGRAHDAQYLAQKSHIVTAVDYSSEAKIEFDKTYPNSKVNYVCQDFFDFAKEHPKSFDLIFDHTFFCAIDPDLREATVKAWHDLLVPGGFLMGVFFVLSSPSGPPFGATEWEIEQHLKKHFKFFYWTRSRLSIPTRVGKELLVYAQKI